MLIDVIVPFWEPKLCLGKAEKLKSTLLPIAIFPASALGTAMLILYFDSLLGIMDIKASPDCTMSPMLVSFKILMVPEIGAMSSLLSRSSSSCLIASCSVIKVLLFSSIAE
ncbi:hypothetical protein D3C78_1415810 [compost metagenome]